MSTFNGLASPSAMFTDPEPAMLTFTAPFTCLVPEDDGGAFISATTDRYTAETYHPGTPVYTSSVPIALDYPEGDFYWDWSGQGEPRFHAAKVGPGLR